MDLHGFCAVIDGRSLRGFASAGARSARVLNQEMAEDAYWIQSYVLD